MLTQLEISQVVGQAQILAATWRVQGGFIFQGGGQTLSINDSEGISLKDMYGKTQLALPITGSPFLFGKVPVTISPKATVHVGDGDVHQIPDPSGQLAAQALAVYAQGTEETGTTQAAGFYLNQKFATSGIALAGEAVAYVNNPSGTVAEGLGFAIPINTARVVSEQLIQKGHVSRPYLGITYQPITPRVASIYRLPVQYGVYITDVSAGSPASQAGLRVGDIITGIDNTNLDETHAYINTLFQYSAGDTVTLTVNRDGSPTQVKVTLGESGS